MRKHNKQIFYKTKNLCVKITAIIFIILTGLIILYNIFITPIVVNTLKYDTVKLATNAINQSISTIFKSDIGYNDLINISMDNSNKIKLIQAKSYEINKLVNNLTLICESSIEKYGQDGIKVNLGTFSGISILNGIGPKIKVKVAPIGAISCTFSSKFDTSGINQTIHRLYANVTANVGVVIPFFNSNYEIKQQVLLCENIILGEVPEVYLYSDSLDNLLNFVPIG